MKRSFPDQLLPPARKAAKIDSFFHSSKPPTAFQWLPSLSGTCLHGINLKPPSRPKVAAFDLDGTLIANNQGSVKWSWWHSSVPEKLLKAHNEGFSLVIISNQGYQANSIVADWENKKIPSIAAALPEVSFRIFGAKEKDQYRKPLIGVWNTLEHIFAEEGVIIDKDSSFFVGDAAGRPGDFSGTDRKWAINVGLRFFTPQEYFLGAAPAKFMLKGFNVSQLPKATQLFEPTSTPLLPPKPVQELVILVGMRCVGKTTFYRRHLQSAGYVHVDYEGLGPRCLRVLQDTLSDKKSCALELNSTPRKKFIDATTRLGIRVRCFYFSAPETLALHNSIYRSYNLPSSIASKEPKHAYVAKIEAVEKPSLDEGFFEIKTINWIFEGTEEERKHWSMWHTLASRES